MFGLAAVWFAPILDDPLKPSSRSLLLSPGRWKRLLRALEFQPRPKPDGWTGPFSRAGTFGWFYRVGNLVVVSWVLMDDHRFWVGLFPKDRATPIDDARAAEILSHFRAVGPFAELAEQPESFVKEFPGGRTWIAMPHDVMASLPVPPKLPQCMERPMTEHLAAVRGYLPAKLPFDWSVPVAVTKVDGHDGQGIWMIVEDDIMFLVQLVTSDQGVKLAVTLYHPDATIVNEARAYGVLQHFRGIREFVQTDISNEIAGARMYLGEIEAHTPSAAPN